MLIALFILLVIVLALVPAAWFYSRKYGQPAWVEKLLDTGLQTKHGEEDEQKSIDRRKKLRRIEIKTRKLSNQLFSGSYHSAFKGRGISFSEVREYQYGDDVRAIDWNVTARLNAPYIKVFEEERELNVMLLIDVSQSSFFGSGDDLKNQFIAEVCGVLAFSAIQNNDKIGVILFSDKIEKFIPPKKGKGHIMRVIAEIYDFKPSGKGTDIAAALRYFNNMIKKSSITFLVSDFMQYDNKKLKDALNVAGRKHDLIGLHIYDKRDAILEDAGLMLIKDAESGSETWVNTSNEKVRHQYGKHFHEHIRSVQEIFLQSGAQLESIPVGANYAIALRHMFRQREMKR